MSLILAEILRLTPLAFFLSAGVSKEGHSSSKPYCSISR